MIFTFLFESFKFQHLKITLDLNNTDCTAAGDFKVNTIKLLALYSRGLMISDAKDWVKGNFEMMEEDPLGFLSHTH